MPGDLAWLSSPVVFPSSFLLLVMVPFLGLTLSGVKKTERAHEKPPPRRINEGELKEL